MTHHPKPPPRIKDRDASLTKLLRDPACRACSARAANCHHLLPKGARRGDDVVENLIPLCGSGSHGCHGALHGNPYEAIVSGHFERERRDEEWVRRRIGERLRPDERAYVQAKLGEQADGYLHDRYYVGA